MCEAPAGGEGEGTGVVERMTIDDLVNCLHSTASQWMERTREQTREALGLADLQEHELMKFRWELFFLCMHATLMGCDLITPKEKAESVRTAYLTYFRQWLQGSGMHTTAITQLINTWNRRYDEYSAAFLITSDPGPIAHISKIAVENIFGEPKEDAFAVFAVTSFYGPFLQMVFDLLERVEVEG